MTGLDTKKALWIPAWHSLDQKLILNDRQRYHFYVHHPSLLADVNRDVDLVFYNRLKMTSEGQVRWARIIELWHPELGFLNRVDTGELDYVFQLTDGTEVRVNAEEHPGKAVSGDWEIEAWEVIALLSEVSEPLGDAV